jgi:AmmeMemoRadiSam system protein B
MHDTIRPPAVAGTFYPGDFEELDEVVGELLAEAERPARPRLPKALVVPHAGYVYSGPVAASAFVRLAPHAAEIRRVVLVGPAHRAALSGLAWPGTRALRTPLGDVPVDVEALSLVPEVRESVEAHRREHSLEVELPFLQRVAPEAKVVPLVVGRASAEEVGRVIDALWGGPETVVVVSSDLSHYLPYDRGRAEDEETCARIVTFATDLRGDEACGAAGINGLAWVARRRGLHAELCDRRSSGDTAGSRDEVVGYAAFAFYEEAAA